MIGDGISTGDGIRLSVSGSLGAGEGVSIGSGVALASGLADGFSEGLGEAVGVGFGFTVGDGDSSVTAGVRAWNGVDAASCALTNAAVARSTIARTNERM